MMQYGLKFFRVPKCIVCPIILDCINANLKQKPNCSLQVKNHTERSKKMSKKQAAKSAKKPVKKGKK